MRMRTSVTALLLAATALVTSTLLTAAPAGGYAPTDAERARWTLGDMRSLGIAFESYKKDHGAYPAGGSLDAVLQTIEPMYIRKAPAHDAWGTAFKYMATPGGATFTLASAGSDGSFSAETWSTEASDLPFEADAVMTSEGGLSLTRVWQYR